MTKLSNIPLGKPRTEASELESQLESLQGSPPVSRSSSGDYEYVNFYSLGVSLCYFKNILDSIEFHNKPEGKFSSCDPALYPSWFPEADASGKDLVVKFGEPLEKGGGTKKETIDIWLRWKGFQVEMPTKNWDEAKDVIWCQLMMFQE